MTMLLYHVVYDDDDVEAIAREGLRDRPLYRSEKMQLEAGDPRGVALKDDPILSFEHVGCEILRVELACTDDELVAYEMADADGTTDHIGELLEGAWLRTRIPVIATTSRYWIVPAEWLRPRTVKLEVVRDDPEVLWEEVARNRRRSSRAPPLDPIDARLAVLARVLHGRWFDRRRFDEDKRPGTIAIQESVAIDHFDRLVQTLARMNVPLERCGWLLAEAARRVAIDSARHGKYIRQKRAAEWKSKDARALDDPEVKAEAERLAGEGVPIARLRRRLLAKFGPDRVPSETVIRRRWLTYVRYLRR